MKITTATVMIMLGATAAMAQTTTTTTGTGPASTSDVGNVGNSPRAGVGSMTTPSTNTNSATADTTTGSSTGSSTMGKITPPGGIRAPAMTANQTPQTTSAPNASAVQTNNASSRTAAAPVSGRNSFTMGEARRRIISAGYSDVKGLQKDAKGIWRGQAQKDGAATPVSLDYQGNVTGG